VKRHRPRPDSVAELACQAVGPVGELVRLCLVMGCPMSAIREGAMVDPRPLVEPRSRARRAQVPQVGVHALTRLVAWAEWVASAHAWSMGEVGVDAVARAAIEARLVGCRPEAWAPGGLL